MYPGGPIPEHPAPVSGSGLKLHARAGLLCNDGPGVGWLGGLWINYPYYQVDHFFEGGPIIIFESVTRYILLQLLFLHLYNHHSHL